MAIVRPVSAFISVSLTASGAWSEMNGISPLMPMIADQEGWSSLERELVLSGHLTTGPYLNFGEETSGYIEKDFLVL